MAFFWHWIVRAPFALAGVSCLALGIYGAFEWSLSLAGLAAGVLVADAAHHLGNGVHRRRRRKAVREAMARAEIVRQHMAEDMKGQRAA